MRWMRVLHLVQLYPSAAQCQSSAEYACACLNASLHDHLNAKSGPYKCSFIIPGHLSQCKDTVKPSENSDPESHNFLQYPHSFVQHTISHNYPLRNPHLIRSSTHPTYGIDVTNTTPTSLPLFRTQHISPLLTLQIPPLLITNLIGPRITSTAPFATAQMRNPTAVSFSNSYDSSEASVAVRKLALWMETPLGLSER